MTKNKIIFLLCCGALFTNCVSSQRAPSSLEQIIPGADLAERNIAAAPVAPSPSGSVAFEQAISQPVDGLDGDKATKLTEEARQFMKDRRKFGQIGAFKRICKADKEHPFCIAYEYKNTPVDRNRERKTSMAAGKIHKLFKSKKYEQLKSVGLNSLLGAAKKMKFENLRSTSADVVSREECLSEDLYVALGSVLEIDFPSDEVVSLNNQLLAKTQKCFPTELSQRSAFRLGMFKVWKNQCDDAIPMFETVLKDQSVKNLHARSTYWREWCKNRNTVQASNPSNFYKEFPQSYNNLLADDGPTPMAYTALTSAIDPNVKFRTDNNPKFNALLDTLDAFIRINEGDIAFDLMESLKTDQIQNEEPNVLLYFSILCNRVQFGLLKFKLMAKVFEKNPEFRSLNTMKLFYPAWYLDVVTTYKDRINPFLMMALIRQESAFNPRAHSAADARGLMQLLPMTGKQFGRVAKHQLFDPKKNIDSGVRFFSYLMNRYNNQVHLALAAYNAGPTTVDNWMKRYPTDNTLLFTDMVPFKETREYVGSILKNWYWYNQLYGSGAFPSQQSNNTPLPGSPPLDSTSRGVSSSN